MNHINSSENPGNKEPNTQNNFPHPNQESSFPKSFNWENLPLFHGVKDYLKQRGIGNLYPPQVSALSAGLKGHNLLVSIPTASGKTLIAEIIALNRLMQNQAKYPHQIGRWGKILYLTPLRALAAEKYLEFSQLWLPLGFHVGISRGDVDEADMRIFQNNLILLTNEKADSIFRLNPKLFRDIDMVIVDEIHLLRDASRGITLEFLLTRLLTITPPIQIIGLSATILNAQELAHWMRADLVTSSWRPVKLKEGYYYADSIFFQDGSTRRVLPIPGHSAAETLTLDTLKEGGQVLIFCNSRKSAVKQAESLSPKVRITSATAEKEVFNRVHQLFDEKYLDDGQLSHLLSHCLKGGVAFHHAGMASEQLEFIVKQFNSRRIKVICCTPTLAAGVNTPARRVIIKTLYRYEAEKGSVLIPVLEYKQMAGRAGRPGYDPYGEVVILGSNPEKLVNDAVQYINGTPERIESQLAQDQSLSSHVLGLFLARLVNNQTQLMDFMENTFYYFALRHSKPDSATDRNNGNDVQSSGLHMHSSLSLTEKNLRSARRVKKRINSARGRGNDPLGLGEEDDTEFKSEAFLPKNLDVGFHSADEILEITRKNHKNQQTSVEGADMGDLVSDSPLTSHNLLPSDCIPSPKKPADSDTKLISYEDLSQNSEPLKKDIGSDFHALVNAELHYLWENELLEGNLDTAGQNLDSPLTPTKFGEIVGQSYLQPHDSVLLREDLIYAKILHFNGEIILHPVSWLHLLTKTSIFPKYYLQTREYSAVLAFIDRYSDHFIMEQVWEPHDPQFPEFAKEIKMTMILFDWISEVPQHEINERYNIGLGDIHRIIDAALWILRGFQRIARLEKDETPNLEHLEGDLTELSYRIKYGIKTGLVSFVQIPGIGRIRARKIHQAGYQSLKSLKGASIEDLSRIPLIGPHTAQAIFSFLHPRSKKSAGKSNVRIKLVKKKGSKNKSGAEQNSALDKFMGQK